MRAKRWNLPVMAIGWLILLALKPAPILGDDDGGGRSVFAHGAGNRALALGGAFVAVADDASGLLWNPAGLGWAEQPEFQATHTNMIGMGFSEQYASLVMPHWRWGAVGVFFRKFGVDGIEERDDRNFLLDDNLSDSEFEIGLGYGRKLGPAVSVGGVWKLRRQSLAGYTGSGMGFDLGLLVEPLRVLRSQVAWSENLTLGLALRNAIEPSVRLDEESVPDPTALRAGLAYVHPLGGARDILLACDVEKTQDMGARVHAGVEVRLHPVLALRAGLNDGTLTVGTGLVWRGVGLDYVFEDHPYRAVHRVGLSLRFGSTLAESRAAAFAAEQERLELQLADAFEKQNRNRIRDLFTQAEMALTKRRFDTSLQILATIEVLDPDNERVQSLTAGALREKGLQLAAAGDYSEAAIALSQALALAPQDSLAARGLSLVREEVDRRAERSAEIRRLFNQAMDAFAAEDLQTAQSGFARVLAVDPDDGEARAMLQRIEESIRHRTANLLMRARTLLENGRPGDAQGALRQVRDLDPTVEELAALEQAVADAQQTAARMAAAEQSQRQGSSTGAGGPSPGAFPGPASATRPGGDLSEQKQREVSELYRLGMSAREEGRVDDAIHYWELVWQAYPGYERVSEYLKHEYLTRGMEAFVSGNLDLAVRDWEKAVRVDPNDQRARGYLDRAQQQLARMQKISGNADR
jgi:tetratricopeptide (TPR) repeat protein